MTPVSGKPLDVQSFISSQNPRSVSSSKKEVLSFVGSSIMRRTDVVVSNKKFFSNSGGLGPVNVGSEDWVRAKEKQDRIA